MKLIYSTKASSCRRTSAIIFGVGYSDAK